MSSEYMEKDICPRCGQLLQPMSIFRVDLKRNWNDTTIQSFLLCHTCMRNIEEYIRSKPQYNEHGYDCSEKRTKLLGYIEGDRQ